MRHASTRPRGGSGVRWRSHLVVARLGLRTQGGIGGAGPTLEWIPRLDKSPLVYSDYGCCFPSRCGLLPHHYGFGDASGTQVAFQVNVLNLFIHLCFQFAYLLYRFKYSYLKCQFIRVLGLLFLSFN